MIIEFGSKTGALCLSCGDFSVECHFFRIHEEPSHHPLYRTLYTVKGALCDGCRSRGESYMEEAIHRLMREYIGDGG